MGIVKSLSRKPWPPNQNSDQERICLVSVCCDVRCVLGTGPLGWEGTILPSKASILLESRAQRREERLRWKRQAGW